MHRVMALSTILMNAGAVGLAILFAIAAHDIPEVAGRAAPIYAGVLLLASFASERIRAHVLVHDPENSPECCTSAMTVSRALLAVAWVAMIVLLFEVGLREFA
jgi:hypothetical protein